MSGFPAHVPSDPTPRQQQVLDRMSRGETDKTMGTALGISTKSARFRCTRLLTRLGADNRPHAVRIAFERALLLSSDREPLAHKLSSREQQVLDLISWGATNEQLARRLYLTDRYTRQVITTLYRKLGATNRPHAVRLGFEHGLLKPHQRWGGAS